MVLSGPGSLCSVLLTAGSDAASLTIYNNTAGSGTVVAIVKAAAGASVQFTPAQPLAVGAGLYAVLTGTSPACTVGYL